MATQRRKAVKLDSTEQKQLFEIVDAAIKERFGLLKALSRETDIRESTLRRLVNKGLGSDVNLRAVLKACEVPEDHHLYDVASSEEIEQRIKEEEESAHNNDAHEQKVSSRNQPNNKSRLWIASGIGGAAVPILIAWLVLNPQSENIPRPVVPQQSSLPISTAQVEPQKIVLTPSVGFMDKRAFLDGVYITGISSPHDVFYSQNGKDFSSATSNSNSRDLDLSEPHTLIFSVRQKGTDKELYREDRSEWWAEQIDAFLEHHLRTVNLDNIVQDELICDISGCYVNIARTICSPVVEKITLRSEADALTLSQKLCENEIIDRYSRESCFPASDLKISLSVENPLSLEIDLWGGETKTFSFPVVALDALRAEPHGKFRGKIPYDLPTRTSAENEGAFAAVITFEQGSPTFSRFHLAIGLDQCRDPHAPERRVLYLNIDDKGFFKASYADLPVFEIELFAETRVEKKIRANGGGASLADWSLPLDRISTIEVATGSATSIEQILGTITFDPEEIVKMAMTDSAKPSVVCRSSNGPQALRSIPMKLCIPENRLAMFDVSKVFFSPFQDAKPAVINIDFSYKDYIENICDYRTKNCPPFVFEVPSAWENVYSQFEFKDGTKSRILRHLVE